MSERRGKFRFESAMRPFTLPPCIMRQNTYPLERAATKRALEGFLRFREGILPNTRSHGQRRVRVAVIDTGVDGNHPYIKHHALRNRLDTRDDGHSESKQPAQPPLSDDASIVAFRDFTDDSDDDDDKSSTPIDMSGHGTFVAGLLTRLAPEAKLFVARVATDSTSIQRDNHAYSRVAKVRGLSL
jgi:Subtilase family